MRIREEDVKKLLKTKYNGIHLNKIEEKQAGGQGITFLCTWESNKILNTVFLKVIDIEANVRNKFQSCFSNYSDADWLNFAYGQIPRFEEEADYYRSFSNIKEVINIYDSWIDDKTFKPYPVMVISFEAKDGDISDIPVEQRTEALGKKLCYSVAEGLRQMNERVVEGVFLHKDIKQENILYDKINGEYCFFIADLGVSRTWNELELQRTIVDHSKFLLFDNNYTVESDIYLVGMLLYVFLNGWNTNQLAGKFKSILDNKERIFDEKTGEFLLHKPAKILEDEFWELIKGMLNRHKEKRPTLVEIIEFFKKEEIIRKPFEAKTEFLEVDVKTWQEDFVFGEEWIDILDDAKTCQEEFVFETQCIESMNKIFSEKKNEPHFKELIYADELPDEVWSILKRFIDIFKEASRNYEYGCLWDNKKMKEKCMVAESYLKECQEEIEKCIHRIPALVLAGFFDDRVHARINIEVMEELKGLFVIGNRDRFFEKSAKWLNKFFISYIHIWLEYYYVTVWELDLLVLARSHDDYCNEQYLGNERSLSVCCAVGIVIYFARVFLSNFINLF